MAATTDLWGPLEVKAIRTPVTILREQAALLREKTNGVLEGHVEPFTAGQGFGFHFSIVAPALDGYRYRLFGINHGVELYPVISHGQVIAASEEEFTTWLSTKLSSPETKRVITSLIAQSTT